MELLVVIGILGIIAAIAIPRLQATEWLDNAEERSMKANVQTLANYVTLYLMDGYDTEYHRNDYNDTTHLSNKLEMDLEVINAGEYSNRDGFQNSYSGGKHVVNWSSVLGGEYAHPAVFITNCSLGETNSRLNGSLIVHFPGTGTIDIFWYDNDGVRSDSTFPISISS